jgi:hypothetical protein
MHFRILSFLSLDQNSLSFMWRFTGFSMERRDIGSGDTAFACVRVQLKTWDPVGLALGTRGRALRARGLRARYVPAPSAGDCLARSS